jgi:hypothetical protein
MVWLECCCNKMTLPKQSEAAEEHEKKGGKCEFELTLTGPLRLHPVKFISHHTASSEHSWLAFLHQRSHCCYLHD